MSIRRFVLTLFLLFCFFFPAFPARTLRTHGHRKTRWEDRWEDFTLLKDAKKGSHVSGISELKKYLNRFGYISNMPNNHRFTNLFDEQLESAVFRYQKNLGLSETGKLDSDTISTIMSPRCGVSDSAMALHTTDHFAFFNGRLRWVREPMILSYAFSPVNMIHYIPLPEIKAVFHRAFSRWASVTPLTFTEIDDYNTADIKIAFYGRGDHGDGGLFDGVLGILGHAVGPTVGKLHLDAAETWAVDFNRVRSRVAVDMESVATHEIGHVLGLEHSSFKKSVMYPSMSPRKKKRELNIDDVEGIQALYGSNPDFKISSLSETERSTNVGVGLKSMSLKWISSLAVVAVLIVLS